MHTGLADQCRQAFQKQNRFPAIWGAIFGSLPPLSAFAFAHFGVAELTSWRAWTALVFVLACLAFSAPKIYRVSVAAFGSRLEAVGFTVLLEGAMTLADHSVTVLAVVSYACLVTLVLVNAIVTGFSVALDQKALRATARAEKKAVQPPSLLQVVRKKPATAGRSTSARRKAGGR